MYDRSRRNGPGEGPPPPWSAAWLGHTAPWLRSLQQGCSARHGMKSRSASHSSVVGDSSLDIPPTLEKGVDMKTLSKSTALILTAALSAALLGACKDRNADVPPADTTSPAATSGGTSGATGTTPDTGGTGTSGTGATGTTGGAVTPDSTTTPGATGTPGMPSDTTTPPAGATGTTPGTSGATGADGTTGSGTAGTKEGANTPAGATPTR